MEEINLELTEYSPETTSKDKGKGDPALSFNVKAGLISLNKSACDMLSIDKTKKVLLHQNKKDKTSWYLEVSLERGFELRIQEGKTGASFNNTSLVKEIFESIDFEDQTGGCFLSKTSFKSGEKELYFIVTNSMKSSKRKSK